MSLIATLEGSLKDYKSPEGPDLVHRGDGFFAWQDARRKRGFWPYARSTDDHPATRCAARTDNGEAFYGVNFGSQDYLSLSFHPAIKAAAVEAVAAHGVHSAGSAALLGNSAPSVKVARAFSDFLNGREIVLYPTGWSAGYGAIQGLVRPNDHIVMDILAHSCLQEGARAATQHVHLHGHLSAKSVRSKVRAIREKDTECGILVVTESLFSMHSDVPDFAALREVCDEFNATLLVDAAHDLGSMGRNGLGNLGDAGMLDAPDIIISSFSKTFASNGGFVAVKSPATAEYLKYYSAPHTFSNALSPVQAAIVLKALEIVRSSEGDALRAQLMQNIVHLTTEARKAGLEPLGEPSPIVPIRVGSEALGRLAARQLMANGCIANLVEYPAVPRNDSRFRFQVMAAHTKADVDDAIRALSGAIATGTQELDMIRNAEETGEGIGDAPPGSSANTATAQ